MRFEFFESIVEVPRIRVGRKQSVETLINEEALLFAKFIRNESETWNPRIASLLSFFRSTNMGLTGFVFFVKQ